MKMHTYCPRCGTAFTSEDHACGHLICACGWFDDSIDENAAKMIETKAIKAMTVFAVVFVLGFCHLGSWGRYAFSIPFTKIAQMTGTLSRDGYKELAQACIELNKWSCAETAFSELASHRGDIEALAQLGSLDARLNRLPQSVLAYTAYEKAGGRDQLALVQFAKVLEASNQETEAMRVYEKSIQANPETLSVQATAGIVRLLMKHGSYVEAYERILTFHDSAENAKGYLNTEEVQLEKQLGETAIHEIEKKRAHAVARS